LTSLIDYLEAWVAIQPDKRLSSFLDVQGREKETYTYLSFHERTRHLAEYLLEHVQLKRGDRVLLVYPPGLEAIVAFFACARIGVIPVPTCPPSFAAFEVTQAKLTFLVKDCQAATALTTTDLYRSHRLPPDEGGMASPWPSTSTLPNLKWVTTNKVRGQASHGFRNDPDGILFLQYTSGSTSNPKGVVVSHENVIQNGLSTLDHTGIGVSWLPQYHDLGLIGYYLFPILTGSMTYGFSPLDFLKRPLLWLQTISRFRATYASSPNFGFEYCLREDKVPDEQLSTLDLSSLRVLMNAAEPVNSDTYFRFLERFTPCGLRPEAHVAAYGLAENTLAATHYGRRIVTVNKRLLQQGRLLIENANPPDNYHLRLMSCGRPLDGVRLRIVDPESCLPLSERQVGEIWLSGKSTCQGYWNNAELSESVFNNAIANDPEDCRYLRTGDLGFLSEHELFVCGRIKDLIIIRGANYYPHDIETIAESASPNIRTGSVVAFNGSEDGDTLVLLAEVSDVNDLPDPVEIARAIRTRCYIEARTIAFLHPRTIAKTTSGKIARNLTRLRWLNGELAAIKIHVTENERESSRVISGLRERFRDIITRYSLTGYEQYTFAEIGITSLTLVTLLAGIEELIQERDGIDTVDEVDPRIIQRMTVAEFFSLVDQFERASDDAVADFRSAIKRIAQECESVEKEYMRSDTQLMSCRVEARATEAPLSGVLITGATGFFGPFLLSSFLRHTPYTFHLLTRAADPVHGMSRIRDALRHAQILTPDLDKQLDTRVHVVCGDISRHNLGLRCDQWESLASQVQAIFHNAAFVNYALNYDALRPHNVDGTRELLRFSLSGTPKDFHLVSSTIIFGWTAKSILLETDNNDDMTNLDFGYAQSKWVAERLVLEAEKQGLKVRLYRPSFISPSTSGVGGEGDIAVLLLAFMINNGVAVDTRNQISFVPADIAAENIALIFRQGQTAVRTFHVTADDYYNMMDITRLITREYGYTFRYYDLPAFVAEMKIRCTKDDPLYPLLYFFVQAHPKLAGMQHKRYDNRQYRQARQTNGEGRGDPPLRDTVSYLMTHMIRKGLLRPSGDRPGVVAGG
jgi:thioester reductase-like protein